MDNRPILYSFRRCPYAIRARLAIYSAGIQVELREVLLREKAPKFLETSESKTVPCLQTKDTILDESLEIMIWALNINDPENWTIILQFANIERQEYYDKDLKSWIGLLVDEPIFDDKAPKNLDKSFMNKRATYKEFKNYF